MDARSANTLEVATTVYVEADELLTGAPHPALSRMVARNHVTPRRVIA
jgi:hypothetical protein